MTSRLDRTAEEKLAYAAEVVASLKKKRPGKPPLSAVGTDLRGIIEKEVSRKLSCPDCLGFLRGLDQQSAHDHDKIVSHLYKHFPWSVEWRANNVQAREAISGLVSTVVPAPVRGERVEVPVVKGTDPLQFIIPYYLAESRSDELRWCIRSIHKFYRGQAQVTLIGDKPEWFVGHHVKKKRLKHQSFRRYRDTLSKIDMIRYSKEISHNVMWCMDDCYFLRPFTANDFAQGRVNDRKPGKGSDDWNMMLRLTEAAMVAADLPTKDFSCHLPQMVNQQRWHEMFERFGLARQPLVWETCYGNMFAYEPKSFKGFMLRLRREGSFGLYKSMLENKWLLNHTHEAWDDNMRDWLAEKFPEPSPDERV